MLDQIGSQYFLDGFPVLGLPDERRAARYFSLNPFVPDEAHRCPLECAYCICHQDSAWHHHPERYRDTVVPADLAEVLIEIIFATAEGRRGFPISLCDYADPFVPAHRERVLAIISALQRRGARSMVYITTKAHPGRRYLARLKALLERPDAPRVTVFVSLPPLKPGYELVSVSQRALLLKDLTRLGIPCCWYLRPLVEEWYDEELMGRLARDLLPHVSHHVILSGVVMAEEIAAHIAAQGLVVPAWARGQAGMKRPLPPAFEARLRATLSSAAAGLGVDMGPVLGHRLCGANGNHGYGCLICGRQERYCQLFQRQRSEEQVAAE